MSDEHFIGPHGYRVQGKLIRLTPRGTLTAADAQALTQVYERQIARYGRLMVLSDLRHSGIRATPEARRCLVDWLKRTGHARQMLGAGFGGGALQAATITLLLGAARMLVSHAPTVKLFTEEAAALAWLSEQDPTLLDDTADAPK